MRKFLLVLLISAPVLRTAAAPAQARGYKPDWESLRKHQVPDWAQDAKFGIYAHWGPYAVSGQWMDHNDGNYCICFYKGLYSTNPGHEQRAAFEKHIGKVTEGYGYKDLVARFKASEFDPEKWADLVAKSGAKYAGICAVHHDGFCMWDSDVTDFCAGRMGPRRDIYGQIAAEIHKRGLKTFASFHHARTYKHFQGIVKNLRKNPDMKGADLLDPKYEDLYWFLGEKDEFAEKRGKLTIEFIEKYKPDCIWFDGGGGAFGTEKIIARFFNVGLAEGKEVCVHNKGNFGKNFGVYSFENGHGRKPGLTWPWEDDTPSGAGWCDWPWFAGIEYKKPRDIVVRLCDLVARNGGLLLSLNPRPDGTFDEGQVDLLEGIGGWLEQNGEAIYGTRPWKIRAEEDDENLRFKPGRRWQQPDPGKLQWHDVRFTTKGNTLYAIALGIPPEGELTIKTLSSKTKISSADAVESVTLIGAGAVKFTRDSKGLHLTLPEKSPNDYALAFKIAVKGKLDK